MADNWLHLPNASHIDRIMISVRDNKHLWKGSELDVDYFDGWANARDSAWIRAESIVGDTIRHMPYREVHGMMQYVARGAILCLMAYPECGYMLSSDIGELSILAAMGDECAILLLPACKVLNEESHA